MLKVLHTDELVSVLGVLTASLFTYQVCAIYSVMILLFLYLSYDCSAETENIHVKYGKSKEAFFSLQLKQWTENTTSREN